MSTVLWANLLVSGEVKSDESDHAALYKHADKLDAIALSLALPSFHALCDTTDLRFNTTDMELPEGVESTHQVMATDGAWMERAAAIELLEALLKHVVEKRVRFGLLSNQHAEVVEELTEVLAFARAAPAEATRFNFSVVM